MPIGANNWDEETYRNKLENLELLNSLLIHNLKSDFLTNSSSSIT